MNKLPITILLFYSVCATAAAGNEFGLAAKGRCMTCHTYDSQLIWPSFMEISRTYNVPSRYDPAAEEKRMRMKIRVGPSMSPKEPKFRASSAKCPATSQVVLNDDEVNRLVAWIMALTRDSEIRKIQPR
ncbi:MAG: c-type cytochrome [Betaproteobacteria bacterium]